MGNRRRGVGLSKASTGRDRKVAVQGDRDEDAEAAVEHGNPPTGPASTGEQPSPPDGQLGDRKGQHHPAAREETGGAQRTRGRSGICQLGPPANQKNSSRKE